MSREDDDIGFMRRALQLAARGRGWVEPNPMVGCVLVRRGQVLSEGWHRRFGGPHAEVEALRRCAAAAGATAYVTLEPCCHTGKTPPCTEALIAARVKRVVAAMRDPNPLVAGGGVQRLREAGIQVQVGLLAQEAADLTAPFVKLVQQRRPWVILKWAQSIDGKIATRGGDSKWISDERARAHAHTTRGLVDGILVGINTALRDDPLLTCRAVSPRRIATRIVLDSELKLTAGARLVRTVAEAPLLLFCSRSAAARRRRMLAAAGAEVVTAPASGGRIKLGFVLDNLGARGFTNLLVEGGGQVLGDFLAQRLADEAHVYIAPLLLGGDQAPGPLGGRGPARVVEGLRPPRRPTLRPLGDGWLMQFRMWQ